MEKIVKIDFQLLGTTISPVKISQMSGIKPDVELMRGECNKTLDLPRQNIWSIGSRVQSDEVAMHWRELELVLDDARDAIKIAAQTGEAKFTIVIMAKNRIPSIIIPPEMSEFAGFVSAVIDIDHIQY